MPTKAVARLARKAAPIQGFTSRPARSTPSSLRKSAKGGVPERATKPATHRAPAMGRVWMAPPRRATRRVRKVDRKVPATRNMAALHSEWFRAWKSAKKTPPPPSPTPSARMPMCSTLE